MAKIIEDDRWALINRSNYNTWILYGQLQEVGHKKYYSNIFQKPDLVKMCFCESDILKLECTLHESQNRHNFNEYDPHYFGWINFQENSELKYVWPSLIQCQMCFGDSIEIEKKEKKYEGVLVRLNVKSIGIAPQEEYLPLPIIEEPEIIFEEIEVPVKRRMRKIIWQE